MRKKLFAFATIMSFVLVGCGSDTSTEIANYYEEESLQVEEGETETDTEKEDKYENLKDKIAERKSKDNLKKESDEQDNKKETVDEVVDKIDIKILPTLDMKFAVFVTNNSNTIVDDLKVQLEYLDENDQVIDLYTGYHDLVLPAHTVVSGMDIPTVDFDDVQVRYFVEIDKYSRYVNHIDEVEASASQGNDCVIVQIKNNADVYIDDIEYVVALYKGDELISLRPSEHIHDLGAGQSTVDKVKVYNSLVYKDYEYGVHYDRIEVYLNEASTIGF